MDNQQTGSSQPQQSGEPVKSRWMPRPEQIMILETIFNSGKINPPKAEMTRIRKLVETYGSVTDSNIFYWFQNRRSKSGRQQREIQAAIYGAELQLCAGIPYHNGNFTGFVPNPVESYYYNPMNPGPSSSCGLKDNISALYNSEDFLPFSGQAGLPQQFEQNPVFFPSDGTNFPAYQSEMITVFINGVATEVGPGAVEDIMIFHESGVPLELNENGILVQGLQHGQSYVLVPRIS